MSESPLLQVGYPTGRMMNIGRERAAFRAYQALQRAWNADVRPTHRLPNGLGYFAPDTGVVHGPLPCPTYRQAHADPTYW